MASVDAGERNAAADAAAPPALEPGRNVWRVDRARRAAMLVDAAEFYGALRRTLLRARHSIIIIGWDIDSRTPLVGADGEPGDDLPPTLGPFLSELVTRRPDLAVKLLLWDYSALYSFEREKMPALTLHWSTPPQIELCLDKMLPIGASHHQKVVVVDDAVAFCGGLDLTIKRWDTPEHRPDNPLRRDPSGEIYRPFHDVQLMVDGDAAAGLGDLARQRWQRVTRESLEPVAAAGDVWPEEIAPDFHDVAIGIARTHPSYGAEPEIREIEALFHDQVAGAERSLYIENQYVTCIGVAEQLAQRLQERPELEAVIVAPRTYHAWIEQQSMLAGRIRFMQILDAAGVAGRVRLLYPCVGPLDAGGEDIVDVKIHSKLVVADDRLLRIGSANLCNRSFGLDTECDLVLAAETPEQRAGVARMRNRLLAEHCGAAVEEVAALLERHGGSLFKTLDALAGREHRLEAIDDSALQNDLITQLGLVADPERPITVEELLHDSHADPPRESRLAGLIKIGLVVAAVLALVLAWRYTPLAEWASPEKVAEIFGKAAASPWALPAVLGLYTAASFVVFPITLLIAATAAAFGTWQGLLFATAGSMVSALVTYIAGRKLGARLLRRYMGPRMNRVASKVKNHGILAVTMLRLMPTAPFTLVNMIAGATKIRVVDYLVGTLLGLAPGIIAMSALGGRIMDVLSKPTFEDVALFVAILIGWFGLSFALQTVMTRFRKAEA